MKKRNRSAAFICAFGLAALMALSCSAGETELSTDVIGDEFIEEEAETNAEAETEAVQEETEPRPEYKALDYVTLGQYTGLTVEQEPIDVTEEEIDVRVEQNISLSENGMETLTEGIVQRGDVATIDFEGKKDGVAFEGGTSEGYDLEIGSGTFIPGFEEGLEGVEIGKTVDLDLTFPENYGNADLAGQAVVFTVTVHSVKRAKPLTDELASTLSEGEASTVDAYRDLVRFELEEEKLQNRENEINSKLFTLIANNSTINDYPQDVVDYTVNDMTDYYKEYAGYYGMEFTDFLTSMFGMTEEEFLSEAEIAAKQNLQQEMIVNAVAEQENLDPDEAAFKEETDKLAEMYGFESGEDLVAQYGESVVKNSVVYEMVIRFLRENNTVIDLSEAESESETELSDVLE